MIDLIQLGKDLDRAVLAEQHALFFSSEDSFTAVRKAQAARRERERIEKEFRDMGLDPYAGHVVEE